MQNHLQQRFNPYVQLISVEAAGFRLRLCCCRRLCSESGCESECFFFSLPRLLIDQSCECVDVINPMLPPRYRYRRTPLTAIIIRGEQKVCVLRGLRLHF